MVEVRYGKDNVDDVIIAHKTWGGTIWETWKIYGRSGNDRLIGGFDNDYLYGESGNDTLMGSYDNDELYGGSGDDILYGHDSHFRDSDNDENDLLDGGTGADEMFGGTGSDTYYVENIGDQVFEYSNEGNDTIVSFLESFSLEQFQHIENLTLRNAATVGIGNGLNNTINGNDNRNDLRGGNGNDTIHGAGGNDMLFGNTGIDKLYGEGGEDILFGNDAGDKLYGGINNDYYCVSSGGIDVIEKAGEGIDTVTVLGSFANGTSPGYILPVNVENLALEVGRGAVSATGNGLDNTMTGNEISNTLRGGNGNDTIMGMGGKDYLYGDNGNDTLISGEGGAALCGSTRADTSDYDTLRGEIGANDLFILADTSSTYYSLGNGYATIENFDPTDRIQLQQRPTYQFHHVSYFGAGTSAPDTGILLNNNLIAIVVDYTNLSYNTRESFRFVI